MTKDAIVASVNPEDGMQIEMDVPEADLGDIAPGTPVSISFNWSEDDDDAAAYSGVIASVSHIAKTSEEESDAHFTACVDFTPGEEVRVGMTVVVTLVGVQADESAEPGEDDEALEGYAGEEEPTEDAEDTDNADAAEKPVFGARGDRGGAAKPDGE